MIHHLIMVILSWFYQIFLQHINVILSLLWALASFVYLLKLFFPKWNEFTKFGKLDKQKIEFFSIDSKISWIIFYSFSCIMFFVTFKWHFPPSRTNILHFIHSFRRFFESIFITNFSKRKTHIINLLAGLVFYFMVPITISLSSDSNFTFSHLMLPISIILNAFQHICHKHLASLKKYTIPNNIFFRMCTSPHYFIEICLYSVYFLSSPSPLSFVMACFVGFNLTHSAIMSYEWYIDTFGLDFVKQKRNILIPYVY